MSMQRKELNPLFTFRNFIVDPANEFAFQAARQVSRRSGKDCTPLLLFGDEGLGKTHLMQAIGHEYLAKRRQPILYLPAQSFFDDYIDALRTRKIMTFRRRFKSLKLLLIKGIHILQTRPAAAEELTSLMKTVCECGGRVVATSDVPTAKMPGLFAGLVALFEEGLSVGVGHPGSACRLEILRALQKRERGNVDDTLLTFMAKEIGSNTRTLISAYMRVSSYQKLTGKSLAVPELPQFLQDLLNKVGGVERNAKMGEPSPKDNRIAPTTPDEIQRVVMDRMQNEPKFRDAVNEIIRKLEGEHAAGEGEI